MDRSANPWSDIPKAKVFMIVGANIARMLPHHDQLPVAVPRQWRQADRRRSAHDAHRPQRGPVPAGPSGRRHLALFNGILHVMIERRLDDREFIARAHHRIRARWPSPCRSTPASTAA